MFNKFFNKAPQKKKQTQTPIRRAQSAEVIKMPKMSDHMEYGVVSKWHVEVGDFIKENDVLADVETDKATMELETYESGVVLYLGGKKREKIPVNGILAIIGNEGEDISHLLEKEDSK